MIPLSVPNISGNEWKYVKECLDTGWVSSAGKFVDLFEKRIAKYTKAKYAVACANGTSGLQIALQLAGVKPEDEVIVPTLTFIAPVNTVRYLGAEPIFMDCDNYMNLDPIKLDEFCRQECVLTKKELRNKRTKKIIKAAIPVHIFGNPCDMPGIMSIAQKFHLKVIEDATESLGSYFLQGEFKNRFTGTIGDIGVYSFNGNKIITTGGGGMIITSNRAMAQKARYLTTQAKDDPVRSIHNEVGYNFRLTNLQAALGLAQLEKINNFIKVKKRNYKLYRRLLKDVEGIELMGIPKGTSPNHWFYTLIINKEEYGMDREELMRKLERNNIQTRPVWHPNHLQKPYLYNQAYKIEKALWFWKRVLNLPCSTNLKEDKINKVVSVIKKFKK